MTIVTLTTDFGNADGFVGAMKGVILTIAPEARLVDLSHEIAPQDIRAGANVLARAAGYFPPGTVHLAVVDPGVGSSRRGLLVATDRARFVGPDNGLLTQPLAEPGAQAFVLDRPEYWLPRVSQTFHGRDVFAPVAAHLARGVSEEQLGSPAFNAIRLPQPLPSRLPDGSVEGKVIHVDHFGNLITNIPTEWLKGELDWQCQIRGAIVPRLSTAYADVRPGALVALAGSSGTLEIALRQGNAAAELGATRETAVWLLPIRTG